jgi:hypothetical protein
MISGTGQNSGDNTIADSQLPPWTPARAGRSGDVIDQAIKGGSLLGDEGSASPTGAGGNSESSGNTAGSASKNRTAIATLNTSDPGHQGASPTPGTNPEGSSSGGAQSSGEPTPTTGGTGAPSRSQGTTGQEEGTSRNSFTQLLQRVPSGRQARAQSLPFPIVSNRDWIIPVECTADGIELRTARLRYSIEALAWKSDAEHPLARELRQMIARRQDSVPAGEPPYRPMIRFQVRPDGQYSYYLAYPLLEKLHLPMSRQELEPETGTND